MEKIFIILIIQLVYNALLTIRINLMVRDKCMISAVFGFIESLVYIFGLALVLKETNNIYTILTYAFGFGLGICLGGYLEKKLAIGNITLSVNIKRKNEDLIKHLRKDNFHFTVFEGDGIDGKRYKFDILTNKHNENALINLIEKYEPESFIVVLEPRKYKTRENLRLK